MFLLDSNVVIAIINRRSEAAIARVHKEFALGTVVLFSTIVYFELRYGISKSTQAAKSEALLREFMRSPITIIPFEPADAEHAGDIRAGLNAKGTPIGPYDILIAAQARSRGAVLVTGNRREFDRVPGLAVADWG